MPNPKSERERGDLTAEIHKTRAGYFVKQPSGAVYHVTAKGWRRVPDSVVEEARRMAGAEAA
jgi:hypothetical protein